MEPTQSPQSASSTGSVMSQAQEILLRQLSRQIRSIKIMLGTFSVLCIVMLTILGFVTYKVIVFTHDVTTKINDVQSKASSLEDKATDSLDFKSKLCSGGTLSVVTNKVCTE